MATNRSVRIDQTTTSDEIFAFFDEIGSDNESDIENILNDSDTEFVADAPLPETQNDNTNILTPEAEVHVAESEAGTEPLSKKLKRKIAELKWKRTSKPANRVQQECLLLAEVLLQFMGATTPLIVFGKATNFDELLDILVEQSNLYAVQNGRQFVTDKQEMSAFLGINYIMSINKIPTKKSYWQADVYIRNEVIKNVMTRARFMEILRNLHFNDNDLSDGTDRGL